MYGIFEVDGCLVDVVLRSCGGGAVVAVGCTSQHKLWPGRLLITVPTILLQTQSYCSRQRATPEHYYKQSVKLNWISFYFGHYTAAVGAGNKIAFLVIVWQRRNCFQKDIRLAAEARMARSPPSSIIRKLFKYVWVWQLKKPINKHFGKYFPRDRLLIIYL